MMSHEEAKQKFQRGPLQLLKFNEHGKLVLDDKALRVLRNVKTPVAVVSVAGAPKSGKSSFINSLLGLTKGFDVGHSVAPSTRGVWMWGQPIATDDSDVFTIVLDCESVGNAGADPTKDAILLSLVFVFSSVLMYHSLNALTENAIETLSNCATLISTLKRENTSVLNAEEHSLNLEAFHTKFIWILRDFHLKMDPGFSPSQYLEDSLSNEILTGSDLPIASIEQINKMKERVRNSFPDRLCLTLPPKQPREIEESSENVTPFELTLCEDVAPVVFNLIKDNPKMVEGMPASGSIVADLLVEFVAAVNQTRSIPSLNSVWDKVTSASIRSAYQDSLRFYNKALQDKMTGVAVPRNVETLKSFHKDSKAESLKLFDQTPYSKVVRSSAMFNEYRGKLRLAIRDSFSLIKDFNFQNSQEFMCKVVECFYEKMLKPKIESQMYAKVEDMIEEWNIFFQRLEKDAIMQPQLVPATFSKVMDNVWKSVATFYNKSNNSSQLLVKKLQIEAAKAEGRDAAQMRVLQEEKSKLQIRIEDYQKNMQKMHVLNEELKKSRQNEIELLNQIAELKSSQSVRQFTEETVETQTSTKKSDSKMDESKVEDACEIVMEFLKAQTEEIVRLKDSVNTAIASSQVRHMTHQAATYSANKAAVSSGENLGGGGVVISRRILSSSRMPSVAASPLELRPPSGPLYVHHLPPPVAGVSYEQQLSFPS